MTSGINRWRRVHWFGGRGGWWLAAAGCAMAAPGTRAFEVGERVVASQNVNVRQLAAGAVVGTRTPGDLGTVVGGPQTAALPAGSPLVWWQVNWDTGVDGWSYEGGLAALALVDGIDVSHYQGTINWAAVRGAGYRFAIAKATEGATFDDSRFAANMANGKAAGMIMGAYHFARPLNNTAVTEARHFVAVTAPHLTQGTLWPVLDLEDGGSLGKAALSGWVRAWCAEVERLTTWKSIIYTGRHYARTYVESDLAVHPLWIALPDFPPGSNPGDIGPWPRWTLEQYSWVGTVPGITGDVDLDVFNGDVAMLGAYRLGPITHTIVAMGAAPNPALRGTTVTLSATVSSSVDRRLLLGASLFPAGSPAGAVSDPAHDGLVALVTGTGHATRPFTLAGGLVPGEYDLWMALYNDINNSGKIDAGDIQIGATAKQPHALVVAAGPSYAVWAAVHGLTGPDAPDSADPDLDGESNLSEYAFGSSPVSASNRPWISVSQSPNPEDPTRPLALEFARWTGRPDLTYCIQRSSDLANWSEVTRATNDIPFAGPGVSQSAGDPAMVTIRVAPAPDTPTFLRVEVTR